MSSLNALTGLNIATQVATERTGKTETTATQPSTVASAQAATVTDSVRWSAASTAASALQAPDSDVRMDKVASIQKALADGTYNVSSSDVADSLINSMLGLK